MKKQLSLLLMFTLIFLGSACSDDDEKVPVYEFLIEEELLTLTPPALGESGLNAKTWTLFSTYSWIKLSQLTPIFFRYLSGDK